MPIDQRVDQIPIALPQPDDLGYFVRDPDGTPLDRAFEWTQAEIALRALSPAADKLPYFSGAAAASLADLTPFARTILDDVNAAAARATLDVDQAGTDNSTDVTLAGALDYLTIAGQTITRNAIDLTTDVIGDLPIADGGTGASTAAAARANLGAAPLDATFITQVANGELSNEQALAALATGILKSTTGTGILSIAAEGTDFYAPGGTDVAIVDGGTGASNEADARTNLGLVAGGAGDIWVEKAGDTMTGPLTITPSVDSATALLVTQAGGDEVLAIDTVNKSLTVGDFVWPSHFIVRGVNTRGFVTFVNSSNSDNILTSMSTASNDARWVIYDRNQVVRIDLNASVFRTSEFESLVSIGAGVTAEAQLDIESQDSARVALIIEGPASANIMEVRPDGGVTRAFFDVDAKLTVSPQDAVTAAITTVATFGHNSTDTPVANFGGAIDLELKSSTTVNQAAAQVATVWNDPDHISRSADIVYSAVHNAAALAEVARMKSDGDLIIAGNLQITGNDEVRFYDNGNYVGFEAPALSGDQIWVLPPADGDAGNVLTTDGAGGLSWSANASEKGWAFMSRDASTGTNYIGGNYKFGATDNDFNPSITFGTANASYAAHFFLVQAAGGGGGTDTVIRVTGTTIDDQGNRTTGVNVDITVDDAGAASTYYETTEKWLGQVAIAKQSGPDLLCNYGFCKYWDNNNTDFKVAGFEATWLGAKNDATPDIKLRHHKPTGWTYNNGAVPTPPAEIASMATDHGAEREIRTDEEGSWKRDNLTTDINGSGGEGTIVELITTTNRTYAIGNFLVRITPQ